MTIEILTAATAGFCYGVKRAVSRAEELGEKGAVCGELIHNNDVLRRLKLLGLTQIDKIAECPLNKTLIIRSHGISADEYAEIKARGLSYEDLTCPHVSKIHKIVAEKSRAGYNVIIAGDPDHPEVKGIVGHCINSINPRNYYIVNSPEEIRELFQSEKISRDNPLIMVAQTTFSCSKWRELSEIVKKHCKNAQIFDTICSTTAKRQDEARELAKNCDIMLVLGSKQSSNSRKLAEICKEYAEHTFFIENSSGLNIKQIGFLLSAKNKARLKIGITAGASTSAEKIEEVHNIMSEELKNNAEVVESANIKEINDDADIDFMAEIDKTFKRVYIGNRVRASVVSVNRTEAVVNIGTKHTGYIPADELSNDPSKFPADVVKAGDEIECIVTQINDAEGVVYLSKKRIDSVIGLEKLVAAESEGATLVGNVTAVVNGGVIVICEGSRVFIPASQSGVPKTGNLDTLIKKEVKFKVIEVNEARGRIVGSIRAAEREENDAKKEKFWEEIEEGKKYKGEVKSIESYGVFVDLGGVDGMVHLSELTWNRVRHPKEVVDLGDVLDVYVKSFDKEKRRVSLGAKDPTANPWTDFVNDYNIGDIVTAEIVSLTPFGAFAQIIPGVDGLIHISQISRERISNVGQVLSVGEKVETMITDIDDEKSRISLSIKALLDPEVSEEEQPPELVYSDDEVAEKTETAEETVTETPAETPKQTTKAPEDEESI